MKNLKKFESLENGEMKHIEPLHETDLAVEKPLSKDAKVTAQNIDTLTFMVYIDRYAKLPNPKGGRFPGALYGTLPEINQYAEDNNLTWMSVYDNGYSYASEEPGSYDGFRNSVLTRGHLSKGYLSSRPRKTVLHHSDS